MQSISDGTQSNTDERSGKSDGAGGGGQLRSLLPLDHTPASDKAHPFGMVPGSQRRFLAVAACNRCRPGKAKV